MKGDVKSLAMRSLLLRLAVSWSLTCSSLPSCTALASLDGALELLGQPDGEADGLLSLLSAEGLKDPAGTSHVLKTIGLSTLQDIRLLDMAERLKMVGSLVTAGIILGDRSKLRRLAHFVVPLLQLEELGCVGTRKLTTRKLQTEAGAKKEDSLSVSGDTLALVVTALIGVGGFILQSKAAKAADETARDIDRAQEANEKERSEVKLQLEKVRSQMSDALIPLMAHLLVAINHESELGQGLGFAMHTASKFMAISEHVEPMPAWPHISVRPHGGQPGLLPKMTPYVKYTPEDLAMLEADVEKRQLYIERYTDCIVPCLLDFGELVRRKWHLLEDTGSIFALARYCSQPHMVANRHLY